MGDRSLTLAPQNRVTYSSGISGILRGLPAVLMVLFAAEVFPFCGASVSERPPLSLPPLNLSAPFPIVGKPTNVSQTGEAAGLPPLFGICAAAHPELRIAPGAGSLTLVI